MSLADRIQLRMVELGFSQEDLAEKAGVSQPTIYKLASGKSKKTRYLLEIAQALLCDPEWLLTGATKSFSLGEPQTSGFYDIPRFDTQFSAGHGLDGSDYSSSDTLSVSEQMLEMMGVSPSAACIVTVRGDSMEPTLQDGESILIDTSVMTPASNGIYAFEFEGDLKVKRFIKEYSGYWSIKSDNKSNPSYQDQTIAQDNVDRLRIIGRVAGLVGRTF